MKRIWMLLLTGAVALVSGCASVRPPVSATPSTGAPPYEAWARVLQKHVDAEGRVNFAGLANDRADLDRVVAFVYANGPNNRPDLFPTRQHDLAFHINAYNALSIYKVIETGIPETNAGLRKVFFFAFGKVQVGGQPVSLYDYENKVIRPLGDPRIHMALNCMSVSCPRLPREPFLPETLDQQLERETKYFFSEPRNLKVDSVNKVVTTSEILKFFAEDFLLTAPSLIAFINRYRAGAPAKIPEDFRVDYFPYDWTINRQPCA